MTERLWSFRKVGCLEQGMYYSILNSFFPLLTTKEAQYLTGITIKVITTVLLLKDRSLKMGNSTCPSYWASGHTNFWVSP